MSDYVEEQMRELLREQSARIAELEAAVKRLQPTHVCSMCSLEMRWGGRSDQMYDRCPQVGCAGILEENT